MDSNFKKMSFTKKSNVNDLQFSLNNLFSKLTGEFDNDKENILNEIDRLTKNNKL